MRYPEYPSLRTARRGIQCIIYGVAKRLNRAHWSTKENMLNLCIFWIFSAHAKNAREGPKWGGDVFFRHKKTLPTFWAERILILRIFDFWIFLGSQISGWAHVGPTWAHPLGPRVGPPTEWVGTPTKWVDPRGPTHLGPTWAHPLGPRVGPPTWAPRGPTH